MQAAVSVQTSRGTSRGQAPGGRRRRTEVQQDRGCREQSTRWCRKSRTRAAAAIPVVLGLRDATSIAASVQTTAAHFGKLDIVVNNAAIFVTGTIETVQPRHIELSFAVNVMGVVLMMREAIPHLRAAGGGHIVNLSSRGAIAPGPGPYDTAVRRIGDIFYGPQKSFIEHFSQSQGWSLQAEGISVNVLSPNGRIRTPGNLMAEERPRQSQPRFRHGGQHGQGSRLDLRTARRSAQWRGPVRRAGGAGARSMTSSARRCAGLASRASPGLLPGGCAP
ncbi:MAG: SDR family oxidoreductase [Dehalococcoidia bacterium]